MIFFSSPLKQFSSFSIVRSCAAITAINFRTFSSPPKRNSIPTAGAPHPSPAFQSLATPNLLHVSVKLPILTLYVNVIKQYIAFCDCLLSLGMMFSRFFHIVVCVSIKRIHPFFYG